MKTFEGSNPAPKHRPSWLNINTKNPQIQIALPQFVYTRKNKNRIQSYGTKTRKRSPLETAEIVLNLKMTHTKTAK